MADERSGYSNRAAFIRLLRLGRPYWPWYAFISLLILLGAAAQTGVAQLLRMLVNGAQRHDHHLLTLAGLWAIAVMVLMAISGLFANYVSSVLETKSVLTFQRAVLSQLMRARMTSLKPYSTADLVNRLHDSASDAQAAVNRRAVQILRDVMQVVLTLAYLTYLNPLLTLGMIVISIATPILGAPLSTRMGKLYSKRQQVQAAEQGVVLDSIQGMEVTTSLSLWGWMRDKYRQRIEQRLGFHRRVLRWEAVAFHLNVLVIVVGLLFTLGFGGFLVIRGLLDVGAVAAFLVSFFQVFGPIGDLASQWPQLQSSIANASRAFEVLDLPDEEDEEERNGTRSEGHVPIERIDTVDVRFEGVQFAYDEDHEVLSGFNLSMTSGTVTALVGPSGGGKSTVIQLLLGMYEPSGGRVLVNGRPLGSNGLSGWRQMIGYVSQEPQLFSGTLFDNIRYGNLSASRDEVFAAAKAARVDDFAACLPDGYDTLIGERGARLSGGERQRLAIARALVRNPVVLLLDEPTSALDSANEALVQEALDEAMAGRTTLIVAHRLSTVRKADQIAFVEAGRVVELGTHESLLVLRNKYWKLHQASVVTEFSDRKSPTVKDLEVGAR